MSSNSLLTWLHPRLGTLCCCFLRLPGPHEPRHINSLEYREKVGVLSASIINPGFWFYSDVLTGLTSHFGTRSFVSRRIFPASLILGVLSAKGCCRKCRNSAYIEQKEIKRNPWNKRGKQHFGNCKAFMPKIEWQPLAGRISYQQHLPWFLQYMRSPLRHLISSAQ